MTKRGMATVALGVVIAASSGEAEERRPAKPVDGLMLPARVRLTLADGRRLTSELVGVRDDAFEIRIPGRLPEPSSTILRADVRGLEHRLGGGRRRGAWWGAFVGAAIGGAFCAWLNSAEDGPMLSYTLPRVALPLAAAGAGIGAAVGRERWAPVDIARAGTRSRSAGFDANGAHGPRVQLNWTIRF